VSQATQHTIPHGVFHYEHVCAIPKNACTCSVVFGVTRDYGYKVVPASDSGSILDVFTVNISLNGEKPRNKIFKEE
jgi:hypothetical protein